MDKIAYYVMCNNENCGLECTITDTERNFVKYCAACGSDNITVESNED